MLLSFLMPSAPSVSAAPLTGTAPPVPAVPAPPPAAAPATLANTAIAATAASQRGKAIAAAGVPGGANPDIGGSPATAKGALLGAS